jgi:type II secretory pathway pseudopilin PulG
MELLVVIAIIALLIGILMPALGLLKRISTNLRQKSIFHGFETGLELFSKDFDGYPDSMITTGSGSPPYVCGAQHLVETIAGRDERGFEPRTGWYAPDDSLYNSNVPSDLYDDSVKESLNRRKPIYVELKKGTGVFTMADLYGTGKCGDVYESDASGRPRAPVFTDVFRKKKITLSSGDSVKVGSPILYYKADSASRYFKVSPMPPYYDEWIYNILDNDSIVKLGTLEDPAVKHRFASDYTDTDDNNKNGVEIFYDAITNPNIHTHEKPFNAKTFILISAGWDGIFGTKDDISSFDY